MKYDPIQLINFGMEMGKKRDDPPKTRERKDKPKTWQELWLEEQKRRAEFDDAMKMLKKQMAEEPKKKSWSIDHIALLLLSITPLNWAVLYLLLK